MKLSARTYLALLSLRGVGRKTASKIADTFSNDPTTLEEFYNALLAAISSGLRVPTIELGDVRNALSRSEEQIDAAQQNKVSVFGRDDGDFPSRLKNIPDPPLAIFVKGNYHALNEKLSVAIIGTREPSEYGAKSARRIGKRLADEGVVVVSGLALGCDAEGHWGCVESHGRGVAVLAHGLDKIYPASNQDLADALLAEGGCLISEYPIGTRPQKNSFVDRDRLQSGLSEAVIVIETGVKGGSMHTARFAQEQHRWLFCITHPPELHTSEKAGGNIALLAERKAEPLSSSDDVQNLLVKLRTQVKAAYTPKAIKTEPGPAQHQFEF